MDSHPWGEARVCPLAPLLAVVSDVLRIRADALERPDAADS